MVICPDERLNRALLTTAVSEICRRAGSPYASARNSEGSSVFLAPGGRRAMDERPRRLSMSPPTPCITRSPSDILVPLLATVEAYLARFCGLCPRPISPLGQDTCVTLGAHLQRGPPA